MVADRIYLFFLLAAFIVMGCGRQPRGSADPESSQTYTVFFNPEHLSTDAGAAEPLHTGQDSPYLFRWNLDHPYLDVYAPWSPDTGTKNRVPEYPYLNRWEAITPAFRSPY